MLVTNTILLHSTTSGEKLLRVPLSCLTLSFTIRSGLLSCIPLGIPKLVWLCNVSYSTDIGSL